MSFHASSHQHPEIGRVALQLLTIPVISIALVALYLGLKTAAAGAPIAHDVSNVVASRTPVTDAATVAPAPAVADDPAIRAHEALDPVGTGSGRYAAP